MKPFHFPIIIFAMLVLSSQNLDAQSMDTTNKFPSVKWARARSIDVKHIALDLHFDWNKKQASGTAILTLSIFKSTSKVSLDAALLTIHSIEIPEHKILPFSYDGTEADDALKISLDREYAPGEEIKIKIVYNTNWVNTIDPNSLSGSNGKGLRFSAPTFNDPVKPKEIWSMSEPQSNRYWFPCYDSPNDLRSTEFSATIEKPLMVLSNGNLLNVQDNNDGTRTFRWSMDTPYANHLTGFVVGEYIDVQQEYDGIKLHSYSYPREKEATIASVSRLPDMMKFFSEKTGIKYPYKHYTQAFVQDLPWGIGYNTFSLQSENMVDDKGTHDDFLYLWDPLEAETLANQWVGNFVSPRDWSHVWLSKGFSIYFSRLFNEYKNGREEFLLYQPSGSDLNAYLWDWNSGIHHPVVTRNYEHAMGFITSDNQPTLKAALVLHILRKHLGDDAWWKAVRQYLKSNANQLVTTEDFRLAIEEVTGEPMDWFFDQWIYKSGHPIFEITKTFDATKKQLTINVKQSQKINPQIKYPQVMFFKGKVDIEIDDKVETVWLEAQEENNYIFYAPAEPKLVNFDFESTWIKEVKFEKALDELLYQAENDKDILARRSALMQLSSLAKNEKILLHEKNRICDAYRKIILSNSYWRLKMSALGQLQGLLTPISKTEPIKLDRATVSVLLETIKKEKSWLRANAIGFLGMTRDPKYAGIYTNAFQDSSDRVINQAAIALGKSKSKGAFEALIKLIDRPSWKNQSLMSALNGLRELGDPRGYDVAHNSLNNLNLLRWRLPNGSVWDFRVFAVETIVSVGRASEAFPLLLNHFKKSMNENDLEGIFNNTLLITNLGDKRGKEIFPLLKIKYKEDENALKAIAQFESQFNQAVN